MTLRLPALALFLSALPAAAATDSEAVANAPSARPDWSVTLGAGALAAPSYPGASATTVLPLPFVDVRYRQLFFLSTFAGLGFNAIATRHMQAGVAVRPDLGRSASSSDRLRGWGDLGAGADLVVFGRYWLGPVGCVGELRRQVGAGDGTLIAAGATSMLPLGRRVFLMPTVKLTWANARYERAYFGVDAGQSAVALAQGTSLPVYLPDAGLRDADLSLLAVVQLDDRWSVQSLVRAQILLGSAAASPLVARRVQPLASALVAYRL